MRFPVDQANTLKESLLQLLPRNAGAIRVRLPVILLGESNELRIQVAAPWPWVSAVRGVTAVLPNGPGNAVLGD